MSFDESAYQSSFLKKHRDGKLGDDLLTRYGMALPCTDAQVAAQLAAVRALWNKLAGQTSSLAKPAGMCLGEDERLQAVHGPRMATAKFWVEQQAERESAAQSVVGRMAEELKSSHGALGVVTSPLVDRYTDRLGLDPATAAAAVAQAGLTTVAPADVPETPGLMQYRQLADRMAEGGASSIPALLHPTVSEWTVVGRWSAPSYPQLRLDAVAISAQLAELDKVGKSKTGVARRDALSLLNRAVKDGVDLDQLALYQLAEQIADTAALSAPMAADELRRLGVSARDAAVLAVTLAERSADSGTGGPAKVTKLIAGGQLREARAAALQLPGALRPAAEKEVEQATTRVQELLEGARRAVAAGDEEAATRLVAQAGELSREDAIAELVAVPQPPPSALTVAVGANSVVLRWLATAAHDPSTGYVILRGHGAVPSPSTPGAVVGSGPETTWTDTAPPVSGALHYGVYATAAGRPDGRPAVVSTAFLPPVADVGVDVGDSDVTLRWSLHPDCVAVDVRATPLGSAVTVPAVQRGHRVTGLTEGVAHSFALVARYRDLNGQALSAPATVVSATPRAAARPVTSLRVEPVLVSGRTRIRSTWRPVDRSDVRLRYAASPPPWPAGSVIADSAVSGWGREMSGHRSEQSGNAVVLAELPAGLHHVVPFSVGGGGTVVGVSARVGVTEPVRELTAVRFAGFAKLSWEWPDGVQQAEVEYDADGEVDLFTVSSSSYRSQGARVPLGRERTAVAVRSMIVFGDRSFTSAPVELSLDGERETELSYTFLPAGPRLLAGRTRRVRFLAPEACSGVRVAVVASMAATVPLRAADGEELLSTELMLTPDVPVELEFTVPRHVKRPFWHKAFVVSGPARLVHPPVSTLREK